MTLERLLSRVLVIGSLSMGSYNCDSATSEPNSCVKDTDCKGDRVCDGNTKMCVETTSTATSSPKYNTCSEGVIYAVKTCCPSYKNISDTIPLCCTDSSYTHCGDEFPNEFACICKKKSVEESYNFLNCISPSCPFSGTSTKAQLISIDTCVKKYSAP